ncbi:AAA family ATPase [Buttiauxella gaviniae]|uniref:AAA family ATPase n=1 Tax=Buttiauxella gaviniae TaxID=82990 RepID=A0ABV3NSS4_9ENTR
MESESKKITSTNIYRIELDNKNTITYLIQKLFRERIAFISGVAGGGKSTLVRQLIENYPGNAAIFIVASWGKGSASLSLANNNKWTQTLPFRHFNHSSEWGETLSLCMKSASPVLLVLENAHLMGKSLVSFVAQFMQVISCTEAEIALLLVGDEELRRDKNLLGLKLAHVKMPVPTVEECHLFMSSCLAFEENKLSVFSIAFTERILKLTNGNLRGMQRVADRVKELIGEGSNGPLSQQQEKTIISEVMGRWRKGLRCSGVLLIYAMLGSGLGWSLFGVIEPALPIPSWLLKPLPAAKAVVKEPDIFAQQTTSQDGLIKLFNVWGYDVSVEEAWCDQASRAELECVSGKSSLKNLEQQDLPWIARLTAGTQSVYAVVISANENTLDLLIHQSTWTVKRSWFETMWKGEYTLLWKPAPGMTNLINSKSEQETVMWLDTLLSRVLNVPLSTKGEWTPVVTEKVKLFQKQNHLYADGVAGKSTLIKLMQVSKQSPVVMQNIPAQNTAEGNNTIPASLVR